MPPIRKAALPDASRIAEILIFAKRTSYRDIFRNDKVSFGEMQVLPLAQAFLSRERSMEHIWVYDDGFVKGMLHTAGGEVRELYVDPFFQGAGIGSALLRFAIREQNANRLWVLEKNRRAIRFYGDHGFVPTGERVLEPGTPEYLLRLALNAQSPGVHQNEKREMDGKRFPLFVDLRGKSAVTVGGGPVGLRRAEALRRFGAEVTLVSPALSGGAEGIRWLPRAYQTGDLAGAFLVVAATDKPEVNAAVGREARQAGALFNRSDCPQDCDFFFPAVCEGDGLVAGVTGDGTNHRKTARAAQEIRKLLKSGIQI